MAWLFVFFFISGFCSVLYELVWLRLAMAQFGVTTALTSIVLSVFMAGLGIGSWGAGVLVRRYGDRVGFPPLRLYAVTELLIGVSALVVPLQLAWGSRLVENMAGHAALSSGLYYLISGLWLGLVLVPWCACMGATIPLAMFSIRSDIRYEARRSFSFLYLANVLGAVAGAVVPLFLIELYGFRGTLRVGAVLNVTIAASAILCTIARRPGSSTRTVSTQILSQAGSVDPARSILLLLFTSGLVTMGMEVIWIRLFTPFIGPVVYSFALILASYLLATFLGSRAYRIWSRRNEPENRIVWVALAPLGLMPLVTSDIRVPLDLVLRVFVGVAPFSAVIGFLTPMLVDRWSSGDPERAGSAYAVNIVGCILGPLISGFVLLPLVGERVALLALVLPWIVMMLPWPGAAQFRPAQRAATLALLIAAISVFVFTKDYVTIFANRKVLRDGTATVIATGEGMQKRLLTNGVGITELSPITKMMAHLTLASLDHSPRSALVICFGMGTTFRSVLSWGIPATAVELVPSVPKLFGYYHRDGEALLASPLAHLVIDDGRRYLDRSPEAYDAIIIDPPPPVPAAGSSLLYSEEFYGVARKHLRLGGILQQWLPEGDDQVQSSVAHALKNSFSYVRVYHPVEHYGLHFLASMSPIPERSSAELVAHMPATAITDMMEWGPAESPGQQFDRMLTDKMTLDQVIAFSPATPALQDDRPINEYFLLRKSSYRLLLLERAHSEAVPIPVHTARQ
jgi:spermidine synthase